MATEDRSPDRVEAERVQAEAEEILFAQTVGDADPAKAPAIFVLGSPRTGSTRLYQALVRLFRLPYLCNLANDAFPDHPILVGPLLRDLRPAVEVTLGSRYGKTVGPFQPSEASAIMAGWFGGGHPSALESDAILPGRERHLVTTIAAMHRLFDAPLVIKNAWNCFRVPSLARLLPAAHFVWVRRDIVDSARSDLAARYVLQGDPNAWNSATPGNVADLRRLPYWAQVVENQYEFARALQASLRECAPGRHSVLWFEEAVRQPEVAFDRLSADLGGLLAGGPAGRAELGDAEATERPFEPGDEERLRGYVDEHADRLGDCRYPGATGDG